MQETSAEIAGSRHEVITPRGCGPVQPKDPGEIALIVSADFA
jgi:hypothetical protein